jgi:hypothetical protein
MNEDDSVIEREILAAKRHGKRCLQRFQRDGLLVALAPCR